MPKSKNNRKKTSAPETTVSPYEGVTLCIATPCYGKQVYMGYMKSVMDFVGEAREKGIEVHVLQNVDSLITRARNSLVSNFLGIPDATHLLWVDADVTFSPDQVFRLLDSGHDVCAAAYPFKTYAFDDVHKMPRNFSATAVVHSAMRYVLNIVDHTAKAEQGFMEVYDAATGFMMIKRGVFEKMIQAYPELRYDNDMQGESNENRYLFFSEMIEEDTTRNMRRHLSEDYAFCRRWQNIGGKIYLDLHSKLTHTGPHDFQGDLQAKMIVGDIINNSRILGENLDY